MIVSTTMDVPGRETGKILGLVRENSVRARAVGRDIVAGLRNLGGGEIPEYAELLAYGTAVRLKVGAGDWRCAAGP